MPPKKAKMSNRTVSSKTTPESNTPEVGLDIIENCRSTSGNFANDLVSYANTYESVSFVPGDVLDIHSDSKDLRVMSAEALPFSESERRDCDHDYDSRLLMYIQLLAKNEEKKNIAAFKKKIVKFLGTPMEFVAFEITGTVTEDNLCYHEITTTVDLETYEISATLKAAKTFDVEVWDKYAKSLITEGVCYTDRKVPDKLRNSLRRNIDKIAQNTRVDFHPNSNNVVRDICHPALYPYVHGVSKLKSSSEKGDTKASTATTKSQKAVKGSGSTGTTHVHFKPGGEDFWHRPYEESKFQWLPAPFKITEDGKCEILEYINNLDKAKFPEMYTELEYLFEIFLPYFEQVWSYAKSVSLFSSEESDDEDQQHATFELKPVSLKGRELQVITKIVEYQLEPGQSYEGVWHAEGMSHENIVMTGIYMIDRDDQIEGGDLRFKRAFNVAERAKVFWNVAQTRPMSVNDCCSEGFVPLGYFPTKEGYILIFPNCHIHKIAKLINNGDKPASRRIVVFFVVNPDVTIVSTRDVDPQQGIITLDKADEYRLELMAERKYDKERLNVRDIELCEH